MLKIMLRLVIFIIGFFLVYWCAQWTLSRISYPAEETKGSRSVEIFILTNGVHTDIVMPVSNELYDWSKVFPYRHTLSQDTDYPYVAVGWGDKGFYLETPEWKDLKASVAFKAAFALGTSAVHVTFYRQMETGKSCRPIRLTEMQYSRLVQYIDATLDKDEAGKPIHISTDAQYGDFDAFYEARGSYHLFFTCNTWVNDALKSCGQQACVWTIFDTGIFEKHPL
ncbi:MAG: TIGR02117 family protein [Taibaiella sp.]|nr:TIGR02117 family protein [Taibaiella sp.]